MNLSQGAALGGSITGTAIALMVGFLVGVNWITVVIVASLFLIGYVLAATTLSAAPKLSEYVRGFLVGLNAGMNGFIGGVLVGLFSPLPIVIVVGLILGATNFMCASAWFSQRGVYQGILGWCNWILPMSWPIVALGFVFLLFSLLLSLVTGFQVDYLKLRRGRIDWSTGTFFIKGGLVSNLNAWDTAFNMGNFSFVDMNSTDWHIAHEAGHTLNLAAFGSLFHLFGAFDEIVLGRHARAYSERIAESNSTGQSGSNIPMWA